MSQFSAFCHIGPRDGTWVVRVGTKCLDPLTHLASGPSPVEQYPGPAPSSGTGQGGSDYVLGETSHILLGQQCHHLLQDFYFNATL